MFEIILYEPEIPPNAGNIMRLCANAGCRLHLVRPLGFSLSDKQLERAGMDYREQLDYRVHDDWPRCLESLAGRRMFAVTTRGTQRYDLARFKPGDAFVFGPETRGLPQTVLDTFSAASRLRIPMAAESRSINLANAVSIVLYEAWRQLDFLPRA
ncbi:MAG: TrmH family methyltransferase [Betaproteobacteria bacterium]|nr:TrmH family methyltransferase [Betaproteobacteria bacterium]